MLLVDDTPAMLRYLRLVLELDSYSVDTAGSGSEALERLLAGPTPDVVLLDFEMPGMDGLQTLQRLLELRPALKVIMCSGVDDPGKARQAVSLGAHTYLTKPIQHLYLTAALDSCLRDREAVVSPDPAEARVDILPAAGYQ